MERLKTIVKKPRQVTKLKETLFCLDIGLESQLQHYCGREGTSPFWPLKMDKTELGTDNIYFEMESRKRADARTYDEGNGKCKIPATNRASIETSPQETKKKGQPTKEPDRVAFRPVLLISAAVVAVAFLTAVATLVLALTMMLSRNNSTASKDSTDVYGE